MAASIDTDGESEVKVKYNNFVKLACKVKGYPTPNVTWFDETGNELLSEVSFFEIPF